MSRLDTDEEPGFILLEEPAVGDQDFVPLLESHVQSFS